MCLQVGFDLADLGFLQVKGTEQVRDLPPADAAAVLPGLLQRLLQKAHKFLFLLNRIFFHLVSFITYYYSLIR